ncbi:hypothetical protein Emed_006297 [Eimeria media]
MARSRLMRLLLLLCLFGLCLLPMTPAHAAENKAEVAQGEAEQVEAEEALNLATEMEALSYPETSTAQGTRSTTSRGPPIAGIAAGTALTLALLAGVLMYLRIKNAPVKEPKPETAEQEQAYYDRLDVEIID